MMIVKLQQHFPLRVTDWLLGGILTTWGLVCLYMDPAVWQLPTFSGLRIMGDQDTWGRIAFTLGVVRMVALLINGTMRRTPHVRGFCAFLSVFIWLQLSLAMFNAEISSLGVAIYPWFLFADIYNVYRALQDARESDARYRVSQQGKHGDAVSA